MSCVTAILFEGLPATAVDPKLDFVGFKEADPVIDVVPDSLRAIRVYLSLPKPAVSQLKDESTDLNFVVTDIKDGTVTRRGTKFRSPKK